MGAGSLEFGAWSYERKNSAGLPGIFQRTTEGEEHFALLLQLFKQGIGVFLVEITVSGQQGEHTSHFVNGAAGELEEIGKVVGRITAGTLRYVVGYAKRGGAKLFGEAVEFLGVQLFGQCEQQGCRGRRTLPYLQRLEAEFRLVRCRHAPRSQLPAPTPRRLL
jgi:hypothetical protein